MKSTVASSEAVSVLPSLSDTIAVNTLTWLSGTSPEIHLVTVNVHDAPVEPADARTVPTWQSSSPTRVPNWSSDKDVMLAASAELFVTTKV